MPTRRPRRSRVIRTTRARTPSARRTRPAFLLEEFLGSLEARPLRILSEYLEPLRRFRDQHIQDTVVFFGSARVHSRQRAERELARMRRRRGKGAGTAAALEKWRRALEWSRYYEDARTLARLLTVWSTTLPYARHRFVVCSGGGPGIMEAANRGARDGGGKSIGLNIELPHEQGLNAFVTPDLGFEFHYFFMRKFWFAYLAKALVIFPGGFGTLDELFEFLTLAQTRKLSRKLTIILYGPQYWRQLLDFQPMVDWEAIAPSDLDCVHFCESPEDAFAHLKTHLETHHLEAPSAIESPTSQGGPVRDR